MHWNLAYTCKQLWILGIVDIIITPKTVISWLKLAKMVQKQTLQLTSRTFFEFCAVMKSAKHTDRGLLLWIHRYFWPADKNIAITCLAKSGCDKMLWKITVFPSQNLKSCFTVKRNIYAILRMELEWFWSCNCEFLLHIPQQSEFVFVLRYIFFCYLFSQISISDFFLNIKMKAWLDILWSVLCIGSFCGTQKVHAMSKEEMLRYR